jgi:hypothetical protein
MGMQYSGPKDSHLTALVVNMTKQVRFPTIKESQKRPIVKVVSK